MQIISVPYFQKNFITIPRLRHHRPVHYPRPKNQACVQYRMRPFEKLLLHIRHPQIDFHSDSIFRVLAVIRLLKYILRVRSAQRLGAIW